jgi:hypothetical protein
MLHDPGRCWQFVEDFMQPDAVGHPGERWQLGLNVFSEQDDNTLFWSYLMSPVAVTSTILTLDL